MGKAAINLIGKEFGHLKVLEYAGSRPRGGAMWLCVCSCGNQKVVDGANLRYGRTNSCGCQTHAGHRATHRMSHTTIHNIWCGMRQRCENPNAEAFADYGARGITVCERWQEFENFLADMGEPPKGTSIDRIDNNLGYTPENCRWATRTEQARNKRTVTTIEWRGQVRTIPEWSEVTGIPRKTLWQRFKNTGLHGDDLFKPLRITARGQDRAPARVRGEG